MAKFDEQQLVKTPHKKSSYTEKQIMEFARCADPVAGPQYFMDNYFYIQHPVKGKMLYHPFDYQKRLIDTYHCHRFSIALMPRQTGKSTSAAGYLLWYAMFVPDSTILIAAHKYTGAQEIMQRVRYAYELCPDHIRAGCTSYNKGSLEFENGSRIVSQTTTETTGRGMSITLLYCDEFAFVRPTIAKEFWTSISPTLSTGGKAIITSTPNSDEDQFALIWKQANKCVDEFGNKTELGVNGFRGFQAAWQEHPDRDEKWKLEEIGRIGEERFRREHGCLSAMTTITVKWPTGDIKQISIAELEKLLNYQDLVVDALLKNNIGLQVLTDTGWSNFAGLLLRGSKQTLLIKTTMHNIVCTLDHKFYKPNLKFVEASSLRPRHKIKCSDKIDTVVSVTLAKVEPVYDLLEVEKNHRFYANGILVKNCEFLIYDETLINSTTLIEMAGIDPIERQGQVRWYKKPSKGHQYVVGLDPSLGTGGDYAAIQIYEIPGMIQVGEWQHNKTPIQRQIAIVKEICDYLFEITNTDTEIYYSIENNTIGEAGLVSISEIGEENIHGTFLTEPKKVGSTRLYRRGFTTTNKSKLAACAKLKSLVETRRMHIASKNMISELKTFVAAGVSYAAKVGETDDLVMSTILVLRMVQLLQSYDPDLDQHLRDSLDDFIEPMPFIMTM